MINLLLKNAVFIQIYNEITENYCSLGILVTKINIFFKSSSIFHYTMNLCKKIQWQDIITYSLDKIIFIFKDNINSEADGWIYATINWKKYVKFISIVNVLHNYSSPSFIIPAEIYRNYII